jgi:hypothetical protein
MFLGVMLYFGAVLLTRLRAEVLSRERASSWVRETLSADDAQSGGQVVPS